MQISSSHLEERANRLLETKIKVIDNEEFRKPYAWASILKPMPRQAEYDRKREEVRILMAKKNPDAELIPCYQEPLLDRDQERHLFREMNYLKYRAVKEIGNMDPKRVGEKRIVRIESLLARATAVRNHLAAANFRLSIQLIRKSKNCISNEQIITDAYFDILKAVDFFDYSLGNKFSTYATWVMKRNFYRIIQSETVYSERYCNNDELLQQYESSDAGYEEEFLQKMNRQLVRRLLKNLKRRQGDTDRQVYILENWFGLNGKENKTLEAISKTMGVTKERVRQIKEQGLVNLRQMVVKSGISTYESSV